MIAAYHFKRFTFQNRSRKYYTLTLKTQQCYKGYNYIISDLNFLKKLHVSCDYFFINNAFLSTNMIPLYNSNVIKPGNKIQNHFEINTMKETFVLSVNITKQ